MPSFDVVSQVNFQELDNAVNNVKKEVQSRYDFRTIVTEVELKKKEKQVFLLTGDEMKMRALKEMFLNHCVRRKLDPKCLDFKNIEPATKGAVKMDVIIKEGIPIDTARKIVKLIKDSKLKVQAAIQDDQVRVSGKKIDDLQSVIAMLRAQTLDVPLQFVNMKD